MEATNNPYQAPEVQLTTSSQEYGEVQYFSPNTRIGRLRYMAHSFVLGLASYAVLGGGAALAVMVSPLFWSLFAVGYLGLIVFSVILMIQRLHDLDKSGWFLLLMFVPLANLGLMIYMIFFRGTAGSNNFGLQPPPNKTVHWVLGLAAPILGLVAMIGILAAVALPAYQQYIDNAKGLESPNEYEQFDDGFGDAMDGEADSEVDGEIDSEYDSQDSYQEGYEDDYQNDDQNEEPAQ